MRGTPRERLLAKLVPDPASGCLVWTGNVGGNGYGQIWIDGKMKSIHRAIWEIERGEIPAGYDVDHVRERGCVHKTCANIAHLEPVTQQENTRRYAATKTVCRHGHQYTAENTYIDSSGYRACKTCRVAATRRWRSRNA